MPEIHASSVIDSPAESVWRLLEDFGAIQRWWPSDGPVRIERVEVAGEGVGMIRHIFNAGAEDCVSERLDFIEPAERVLMLSIVGKRPRGLASYVAEGHVVALDVMHCRIDYRARFTTEPGREEQLRKALLKTWSLMFRGLAETAKRMHSDHEHHE